MLNKIKQAVLDGEIERAAQLTEEAIAQGVEAPQILDQALAPAMEIVGEEYENGDRYVPEMLISAEAMKRAMVILQPLLADAGVKARGKVVIGTVEGDLHDIGKDLVVMMLEGAGFKVYDLGIDISAELFVEEVKKHEPDLVGLSALLTTTMVQIPEVIKALEKGGMRDRIKVMVGGAPVTQEYARKSGADGYAPDAGAAVKEADRLMAELKGRPSA